MRFIGFFSILLSLFIAIGCANKNVSSSGETSSSTKDGAKDVKKDTPKDSNTQDSKDVYAKDDGLKGGDSNASDSSGTDSNKTALGETTNGGSTNTQSSPDSNTESANDMNQAVNAEDPDSQGKLQEKDISQGETSSDTSSDGALSSGDTSQDSNTESSTESSDDSGSNVSVDNLTTIYFNFDRYDIRDDMKEYIKANAQYIKDNEIKSITLQGNTDEFGTDEYNMALGQKRALAVRDALVMQGLPKKMFKTISYGTHKPVCQEKNAECYAKNRRTDIVQGK